jgi:hypothetical protein
MPKSGTSVLQRHAVLRAATALRPHADRALPTPVGRGRAGAVAQGHHRLRGADQGGAPGRAGAGDRGLDRAVQGHRPPGGQPAAGDRTPQGGQCGQALRHQSEADLCQGGQDAAPPGRWLRPCQAVQAPAQDGQSPAHDPGRGDARGAAQARCRHGRSGRRRRPGARGNQPEGGQRPDDVARAGRAHPHTATRYQEQALRAARPGGGMHLQGQGTQPLRVRRQGQPGGHAQAGTDGRCPQLPW